MAHGAATEDHYRRSLAKAKALPDVVAAAVVVSSLGFTNKLKAMDPQSLMRINGNGMSTIIISKYCHVSLHHAMHEHECYDVEMRNQFEIGNKNKRSL